MENYPLFQTFSIYKKIKQGSQDEKEYDIIRHPVTHFYTLHTYPISLFYSLYPASYISLSVNLSELVNVST